MYLGEEISKCATLTTLHLILSSNTFGENGAKYLGEGISKCLTLKFLNLILNSNDINENGAK